MEVYKVKYRNILSVLLVSVLCVSAGFAVGNQEKEENNILTVYAYDSFVSEWGPGPIVVPMFEEATGIKVNLVSVGNGGELLTKLELEKNSPKADVVIGISHELLSKTLSSNLFIPYESPVLEEIPLSIQFDETYSLLPFNYASYSFNYDSESLSVIPTSLDDLLDPMYKKSIIIMDPRTSSVGMGLLEWTVMVYGENYLDWWRAVKENILTIADGWSSGYGLFTEGEAPIVLSYITSPVYHLMYEESDRYKST
ncbi:MAG: thiamine ABC transporter substrate-binding protein, partial [Spirochaetia bacterium]|nr:thiamine ABC transporter substrate-binding protein [Spirochaetia bacterium]